MKIQKLTYFLLLFIILSSSASVYAQQEESSADSCYRLNGKYIGSYFIDSWRIIKSPVGWQGSDWLKAGVFAGSWIALYTQDKQLQQWSQRNRTHFTDQLSKYFFDPYGYGFYTMPIYGGLYIYGALGDHHVVRDFALQGARVFIVSAAFSRVIKHITHRHRPFQDDPPNPHLWEGPVANFKYDAFPSGHTITAFATAAFLSYYFEDHKWVPWLSYPVAMLVGYSRMNDDKHWATDVLAGAVLGHYIGKFLTRGKCNEDRDLWVVANNRGGISLIYNIP